MFGCKVEFGVGSWETCIEFIKLKQTRLCCGNPHSYVFTVPYLSQIIYSHVTQNLGVRKTLLFMT